MWSITAPNKGVQPVPLVGVAAITYTMLSGRGVVKAAFLEAVRDSCCFPNPICTMGPSRCTSTVPLLQCYAHNLD